MSMTLFFICVMLAMSAAQVPTKPPSGPCEDLDTASCAGFHKANPALCNDPYYSQGSCIRFCGNCPIECYSCPHAVLHPHDCNLTVTCGATMQCVSKHLRATDGHHEYYLMCETKEICDLFAYGFGKRDLLSAGERTERDIIINCCDTDRCNYDVHTTSAPVITTPKPTTQPSSCYKDIVFVLRTTHLKTDHGLRERAYVWVPFLRDIVATITVGPGHAQMAAVSFDNDARVRWYLNNSSSKVDLYHELDQLWSSQPHADHDNGANVGDAFALVTHNVLTVTHGDRPSADNVVVLLEFNDISPGNGHVRDETAKLHAVSKDVLVVTVKSHSAAQAAEIATDSNGIFQVPDWQNLTQLVPQITSRICA